jgi:hypothetical protein
MYAHNHVDIAITLLSILSMLVACGRVGDGAACPGSSRTVVGALMDQCCSHPEWRRVVGTVLHPLYYMIGFSADDQSNLVSLVAGASSATMIACNA